MSDKGKVVVKALVTGGAASGGPPIGPAVGPTGINIKDVIDAINDQTTMFKGLTVPVRIECDPETKQFEIFIETPSTASLLMKELGVEKGSSDVTENKIGDLTLEQVISVAKSKQDKFLDKTFKAAVKTVLGTALSIGATVDGEDPRVIQKRIDNDEYSEKIKEE
ncbi:MAG: 50S ribosomal protein L11 [Candidatus Lokiarchaeota archaeon]|nr:50S ribosomal protein L11 [Candidatus Lokiarchaeota archaeon]MBD3341435.1 50S ribosomal protein L11 [Candidatus Lokiarchaeota archaeon]